MVLANPIDDRMFGEFPAGKMDTHSSCTQCMFFCQPSYTKSLHVTLIFRSSTCNHIQSFICDSILRTLFFPTPFGNACCASCGIKIVVCTKGF